MTNIIGAYAKRLKYRTRVYSKFAQLAIFPKKQQQIVDQFHKLFYDSNIIGKSWHGSYFLGVGIQKCPMDLFIYQEIIYEIKPDIIIETGTMYGGSAYYMAVVCDVLKKGKIITVDTIKEKNMPKHPRIKYLLGSSIDDSIVNKIKKEIGNKDKVLVILDSDHSAEHVYKELEIYKNLVTKGSYIIVEDTNVNGHPVNAEHGPGPMEGLERFLKTNNNFVSDRTREKLYLTFNPKGYLKKNK